jgi:hypothetical protein
MSPVLFVTGVEVLTALIKEAINDDFIRNLSGISSA